MVGILSGVAGFLVGVLVVAAFGTARLRSLREERAGALQDLAVRDAQLVGVNQTLEREREEHELDGEKLVVLFENLSNRVLTRTVEEFGASQEQVVKERDSKLAHTLKPLEDLLDEYKRNLADFNKEHVGALSDVKHRANELLEAQQKTQEETRRLNQLLGRGDQRGHWGEFSSRTSWRLPDSDKELITTCRSLG